MLRQYYKKIFRIAKIGEASANIKKSIAEKFKNAKFRYDFERKIETKAGLPYGSLVIHCPKYDTSMKQADVLVFGTDPNNVIAFKEITDDAHELISLSEYVKEAKALETSYLSIWNMYFFVQQAQIYKWPLINIEIEKNLNSLFGSKDVISNSEDTINQLKREYVQPARKILDVLAYIESDKCDPKPAINLELINYIESEAYFGKKEKEIDPQLLVREWNKRLTNASERKK